MLKTVNILRLHFFNLNIQKWLTSNADDLAFIHKGFKTSHQHIGSGCQRPVGGTRRFQFGADFMSAFYSGQVYSWCRVMDDTRSDTVLDQHQVLHKTLGYGCLFLSSSRLLPFRTLSFSHYFSN